MSAQFQLCGPEDHLETETSDVHKPPLSFSSADFPGLIHSEQKHQVEEKRRLSYTEDLHHFKDAEDKGRLCTHTLHPAAGR